MNGYDNSDVSRYEDIIGLPHHVSETRPAMSRHDRAAQFAPFAALTGYDAEIAEAGRLTEGRIELTDERKAVINGRLREIEEHIHERPEAVLTCFKPDLRKDGGEYRTVRGRVVRLSEADHLLRMEDGTRILFDNIVDIL